MQRGCEPTSLRENELFFERVDEGTTVLVWSVAPSWSPFGGKATQHMKGKQNSPHASVLSVRSCRVQEARQANTDPIDKGTRDARCRRLDEVRLLPISHDGFAYPFRPRCTRKHRLPSMTQSKATRSRRVMSVKRFLSKFAEQG